MSAFNHGSRQRANAYSESKQTNWVRFDPFWQEARAAFKRFDARIPRHPARPSVFSLAPAQGFLHACKRTDVLRKLDSQDPRHLEDLRGIFLLSGTRKQLTTWHSRLGCYGSYWNRCIFLHAHPVELGHFNLDTLKDFYLTDVLVHEIGHHVDRERRVDHHTEEAFANWFAQEHG
jgi:hypothetical protein